jgi:hypothetical protein
MYSRKVSVQRSGSMWWWSSITYAFHLLQVFVANPNKNKPILDILTKNQERLIVFLSNFHNDRHGKWMCRYVCVPPHSSSHISARRRRTV